jgi:hypothetical protein
MYSSHLLAFTAATALATISTLATITTVLGPAETTTITDLPTTITVLATPTATAASTTAATPTNPKPVFSEAWVIENLKRVCDDADTKCTWTFSVNTQTEGVEPTDIEYIVEASRGAPASRAIGGPSQFGPFTVTSTWTDGFGVPDAWTTLSIIHDEKKILVTPAYKDTLLQGGKVVEPDQTHIPVAVV